MIEKKKGTDMKLIAQLLKVIPVIFLIPSYANDQTDYHTFNQIFKEWSEAFNHKDLKKTCSLFSTALTAEYQGHTRNYQQVCAGLKKIFTEKNTYKYHYKIEQVYRSGNLAAVRIKWFFYQYQNGKIKSITQDHGIDVFKQNAHDRWQIVNYLAYMVNNENDK